MLINQSDTAQHLWRGGGCRLVAYVSPKLLNKLMFFLRWKRGVCVYAHTYAYVYRCMCDMHMYMHVQDWGQPWNLFLKDHPLCIFERGWSGTGQIGYVCTCVCVSVHELIIHSQTFDVGSGIKLRSSSLHSNHFKSPDISQTQIQRTCFYLI